MTHGKILVRRSTVRRGRQPLDPPRCRPENWSRLLQPHRDQVDHCSGRSHHRARRAPPANGAKPARLSNPSNRPIQGARIHQGDSSWRNPLQRSVRIATCSEMASAIYSGPNLLRQGSFLWGWGELRAGQRWRLAAFAAAALIVSQGWAKEDGFRTSGAARHSTSSLVNDPKPTALPRSKDCIRDIVAQEELIEKTHAQDNEVFAHQAFERYRNRCFEVQGTLDWVGRLDNLPGYILVEIKHPWARANNSDGDGFRGGVVLWSCLFLEAEKEALAVLPVGRTVSVRGRLYDYVPERLDLWPWTPITRYCLHECDILPADGS